LLGKTMLSYVPINKTALERHEPLEAFLRSWDPTGSLKVLTPDHWFHEAHLQGNYVWAPQPCIAEVALEQLCESRHCRPDNTHFFVCPALMTNRWRKQLGKAADVIFHLPIGSAVWPTEMHEPLMCALIFPLINRRPWTWRGTQLMADLQTDVSRMPAADCCGVRDSVRKLWVQTRSLEEVPERVARQMLHAARARPLPSPERFRSGRGISR
jgi:hypothetical protein